jgi:histidyl-tRNA synthetase
MAAAEPPKGDRPLDLFIAHDSARVAAFATLQLARRAGLAAQMELAGRSLKGQLKQADRLGARFVAVIEGDGARLRDVRTGSEETVELAALVDRVTAE